MEHDALSGDDLASVVWERLAQAFEGCKPCTGCGGPAEPGEELYPTCADPAVEAEMVVRIVLQRRLA